MWINKKSNGWKRKKKYFFINGYPRNQANIDGWKEVFKNNFILVISIILDCDEDQLVKRLVERGKTSGRSNDNIETIKKRFKTHKEESEPIVKELKKMGDSIEVKASGTTEEVFDMIVKELDEKVKKYC